MSGATNCPETPRQKMIGIMYLVLTAMLALNVSAAILNGYKQVDDSMHEAIKTFEESNEYTYEKFRAALDKNPEKTQENYDKAQEVKKASEEFFNYVQKFKDDMVLLSEGKNAKPNAQVSDLEKQDDTNVPQLYAIEEGNASILKTKIVAYRDFLVQITGDTRALDDELRRTFNTEDGNDASGNPVTWENMIFNEMPMCASLTILSKLQNDIRRCEGKAVQALLEATDAGDLRVNKFSAFVIPSAKTVVKGTKYSAQLILAAIDSTKTPDYYVNGQKLNSKGVYEIVANSVGQQVIKGKIGYMDQQGVMQYLDVTSEYTVTEPMAIISNTDLNIMFRNYENPFSISVPGVQPQNLNVTCSQAKVICVDSKNGKWKIIPSSSTPDKITVVVTAKMDGRDMPMGTQEFRVRKLQKPDAYLEIGGETVEKEWLTRQEFLNPKNKIIASDPEKLVEAKFVIVGYEVKIGKDVIKVTGDSMEQLIPKIKDKVKNGSDVTFRLIKAKDPGGEIVTLRNLTFEIK